MVQYELQSGFQGSHDYELSLLLGTYVRLTAVPCWIRNPARIEKCQNFAECLTCLYEKREARGAAGFCAIYPVKIRFDGGAGSSLAALPARRFGAGVCRLCPCQERAAIRSKRAVS